MATRAERQQALEALSIDELATFRWAGELGDRSSSAQRIAWIQRNANKHRNGDDLDRLLGLPTDAEQQLNLQRQSTNATKVCAVCALLAVVISVVALWVAWHAGE